MIVGVPEEIPWLKGAQERRVGLSPAGASELAHGGATVLIQRGAGEGAGFSDEAYEAGGAHVVASAEEVYLRSEILCKVERPDESEWRYLQPGHVLLGYLHLAAAPKSFLETLIEQRITAIGYEVIQDESGRLPVLELTSQIAGRLTPQLAGRLLERGRGTLLSGIPGVPPADVVILGGGTLGYHAARALLGAEASVYILERDLQRASAIDRLLGGRAVVAMSNRQNIEKFVKFADVLVGAVLQPGARAPLLVTRPMVRSMEEGAVFLDFSIDQGGCSETSRLTPTEDEIYTESGVIHCCMPTISSVVARTATHALSNAAIPYVRRLAKSPLHAVIGEKPELARGVYTHGGLATHPSLAGESAVPSASLQDALKARPTP